MKSIHDLRISLPTEVYYFKSNNRSCMYCTEMYVLTLVRKRGVICDFDFTYIQGVY